MKRNNPASYATTVCNKLKTMSRFWIWLCISALIATWLRVDQILHQVLEGDEWHALHQLTYSSIQQTLLTFGNADFGIPVALYYWCLAKLGLLTELFMRMPMLLSGIGIVLFIPAILRHRINDRVLIIFSLLLSFAPFLVYWSRMARTYSLTLLGSFLAFWLLGLALRKPSSRTWTLPLYALVCGLTVWTHALTGPLLVTPLIVIWIQHIYGLIRRDSQTHRDGVLTTGELVRVTAYTGIFMGLAVLPPLLGDTAALTGKTGIDSPAIDTVIGALHFWFGTGSTLVVLVAGLLVIAGMGSIWRSSVEIRWVLVGQAITLVILFVAQPWWVDRPLAFGRYLLPMVPCLLLALASGIVRATDLVEPEQVHKNSSNSPTFLTVALLALWWPTAPLHEWLQRPNSYLSHMYYQYDYRHSHNLVRRAMPMMPSSDAWFSLANLPRGSQVIAAAPFQYATWEWPAPLWEQESQQRVIPGFLWGGCASNRQGEVPDDGRFQLRNGVHLANQSALERRGVDWVVYYLSPEAEGYTPRLPQCEAWMREHFGKPDYEDTALLAWRMTEAKDTE